MAAVVCPRLYGFVGLCVCLDLMERIKEFLILENIRQEIVEKYAKTGGSWSYCVQAVLNTSCVVLLVQCTTSRSHFALTLTLHLKEYASDQSLILVADFS